MASRETKLQIVVDAQDRTKGTFNALKSNLDGVGRSYQGLTSAMRTAGTAGAVALGSLALLTKGIIAAGAGFEQTQIAFETMIGSADKARDVLGELAKFAARTPFELPQLEEASKRLLAYGLTADDLIPTLKMLGDVSAGVGMDKLPQLILAFGQVRAATKLTGMELRQFSEAGVPLLGTLAAQLGKTEAEIMDMVSEGQIGFEQVRLALASLTGEGGRFFNLMERQSESLGGLWSNLKDQIALTARTIGTELLPYLKPVVEQLIVMTQAVGEFVKEHPKLSAGILIAALAFSLLLAALLPLAMALPGLIIMFGALAAAIAFIVTGPGIAIVATIAAIGAALYYLTDQGYFTKRAWEEVWIGIQVIAAETVNAVIGFVESMVNAIIGGVNAAIRAINRVLALAQKVPGIGKSISSLQIGELSPAEFSRIDTSTIPTGSLGFQSPAPVQNNVIVSNNVVLSEDVAEQIGDLLMRRFKMSNPI